MTVGFVIVQFVTNRFGDLYVSEPFGFFLVCFASPIAWLVGLLTIIFDYISMRMNFKKMSLWNNKDKMDS